MKNSTSKLYCNHEICIYQEEVDYINSKLTLPWIKEFAILVLAYFKFHSSTSMFMGHIPSKDLIPFTSIVRRRQQNNNILWQRLKDFDLIEYDEQRFECSVPYLMNSGTPVVTLCTMADIGELCKLIKNEKICIKCGKHFEYTSMTKRDICEDCWKQERLNKQSERHKRARQHE